MPRRSILAPLALALQVGCGAAPAPQATPETRAAPQPACDPACPEHASVSCFTQCCAPPGERYLSHAFPKEAPPWVATPDAHDRGAGLLVAVGVTWTRELCGKNAESFLGDASQLGAAAEVSQQIIQTVDKALDRTRPDQREVLNAVERVLSATTFRGLRRVDRWENGHNMRYDAWFISRADLDRSMVYPPGSPAAKPIREALDQLAPR